MKIDYEITVDVSDADIETKKRVQDAFFKLGITWAYNSKRYEHLEKNLYTNRHDSGEVLDCLMWCYFTRDPTHTIDQLFELAGMKTETKLIPFDLEKALAGEPVITRDRLEDVTQLTTFETSRGVILVGVMAGNVQTWTKNGEFHESGKISDYDLFMKSKTHVVNGFEVPAPVTNPENMKVGVTYYGVDVTDPDWFFRTPWAGDKMDMMWLARNLVFMNKEDAIANAKAMLGVNPYGESDE